MLDRIDGVDSQKNLIFGASNGLVCLLYKGYDAFHDWPNTAFHRSEDGFRRGE